MAIRIGNPYEPCGLPIRMFEKEIRTSSFSTMKNHRISPYIGKQRTYTTGDNKHSQKDANGSKLH